MARTGPISIHVSRFTEEGLTFEVIEFDKVVGVTITDDGKSLTYDYETGNVSAEADGQDIQFSTLEKEALVTGR